MQQREETINLGQKVTDDRKPKDPIFIDFEKNWRQFISQRPELALPVIPMKEGEQKQPWDPIITSNCVQSQDAGGFVPQVTISWNEPMEVIAAPGGKAQQQTPPPQDQGGLRFDLSIHYRGFARNYYSTALSADKDKRFNLPSNSDLAKNTEAVLLTGPSLFPKLIDYRTDVIKDVTNNREIGKHTLVLRDLSPGLSYTIRVCVRGENNWKEEKEVVFMTPICPQNF
jgi:hypothetical protein